MSTDTAPGERLAQTERKRAVILDAESVGQCTVDGLASTVVYWQDVAQHAHEKRVEAESELADLRGVLARVGQLAHAAHGGRGSFRWCGEPACNAAYRAETAAEATR